MSEQIGTAEEALGAIVDAAVRITGASLNVTDVEFLAEAVQEDARRITAMVRVAVADLHARPQGSTELTVADEPAPEWRRVQFIDRALKWAELLYPERNLLDLARELEAYATGTGPTRREWREDAVLWLRRKAAANWGVNTGAAHVYDAAADELEEELRRG